MEEKSTLQWYRTYKAAIRKEGTVDREAFRIYKEGNPHSSIGPTKFYSLWPRWVQCSPQQEVCVSAYCAN